MTLRDDLIVAKALIDTPEKWCKGIHAGQNCAMWALAEAAPMANYRWIEAAEALRKAAPRRPHGDYGCPVVAFNDAPTTTHADVMALFDRAIAAAEAS